MADEIVWVELRYVVPVHVHVDDGRTRAERAQAHADSGCFYEHLEAPYWPVEADYEVLTDPSDMALYDGMENDRQTHRVDVVFDPKGPAE